MKRTFLEEFRQAAYKYLGRAKDATFELTDAISCCAIFDYSLFPPQGTITNSTVRGDRHIPHLR